MTPLESILARRIQSTGPMRLADWMAECLLHPEYGYYTTQTALGREGDFITAPEVSQIFGEMIGLCLAQSWVDQGRPSGFALAELGPGRGTLMADILRATKSVPGFVDAAEIILLEASPRLRHEQSSLIPSARHIERIENLPDLPLFLVANEFLDALPIRQFQREKSGWREVMITYDGAYFQPGLSDSAPLAFLEEREQDTDIGDLIEYCPALPSYVGEVGSKIADNGGVALFIDYGDWRPRGDSFQAVRQHEYADPFSNPGQSDLTAYVDFAAIATASFPAVSTKMSTQGMFLERLGITARAQRLAQQLKGAELKTHIAAHRRLTHPDEMGNLFKVMGLYPNGCPPPPGLDP